MFSKKTRIVSVRLSDEEFVRLKQACELHGARSLSDLAREAMQRLVESADGNGSHVEGRLRQFDERLSQLQDEVGRLSGRVEELSCKV